MKLYKKIILALGVAFFVLTFFISFNPAPFLKFGYIGVFVFNLFGPGTLLFPVLVRTMNVFLLSLVTALGMAVNDSVSWMVGNNGDAVLPRSRQILRIEGTIQKYGPVALFFWSIIPFPYDLIGIIAGYLEIPFRKFVAYTFLGRLIRFLLLGMFVRLALDY